MADPRITILNEFKWNLLSAFLKFSSYFSFNFSAKVTAETHIQINH